MLSGRNAASIFIRLVFPFPQPKRFHLATIRSFEFRLLLSFFFNFGDKKWQNPIVKAHDDYPLKI